MALNLGTKISAASAIPTLAFLITAAIMVSTNFSSMRRATHADSNMQFVQAVAQYIHETQKERAKAVAYTNLALTKEEMDPQRALADQKYSLLKERLKDVSLDQGLFAPALRAIDYHNSTTRTQINSREITAAEVIKRFNTLIGEMIGLERIIAANTRLDGISEKIRSLNIIEVAKEYAGQMRANTTAVTSANKPITEAQFATLVNVKAGVNANLNSPGLVMSNESVNRLEAFKSTPHWERVEQMFQTILKHSEVGAYNIDPKEVIQIYTQKIDDISTVLFDEMSDVYKQIAAQKTSATRALWSIFISIAVVTLALFGFLTFIVRVITRPINLIIEDLRSSGTQVAGASDQLQNVSQQLSSGATEAAASLEETVSSLEALSSKVKLNAENAQQASALSQASRGSAEQGEGEIKNLISAMTDISRSSRKIEEIINVIDDIAFQTNLLALNAAVEAARAGEQGRGFAVVAEAVRNLAQRSASAAKEITTLIKDSVSQIERGSRIADMSGTVLKEIVLSVKKVADLNNEIAAASQEQASGIQQLNRAMTQLDQTTQSNAASAEEASASAEELSAQSQSLQTLVRNLAFVVDGKMMNSGSAGNTGNAPYRVTKNDFQAEPRSPGAAVVNLKRPSAEASVEAVRKFGGS